MRKKLKRFSFIALVDLSERSALNSHSKVIKYLTLDDFKGNFSVLIQKQTDRIIKSDRFLTILNHLLLFFYS